LEKSITSMQKPLTNGFFLLGHVHKINLNKYLAKTNGVSYIKTNDISLYESGYAIMIVVQVAALAALFLLELGALAAFGYWGFTVNKAAVVKIVLGIGTPLLVAIFWGTFVSPKASIPVNVPIRLILQLVVFSASAAVLYLAGQTKLAVIFIVSAVFVVAVVHLFKF
jgi:hypothetical protein